ncbi:MAG: hypothetical protein Q8R98_11945 [Rubrivivax sp.]|nr:hypothetical protein [Rubrivivax sp.]
MDPKCIAAVRAAAAGRSISDAKLAAIEGAIVGRMRDLARSDRQRWLGLSKDQRMIEAVTAATKDVVAQAELREYRETLQILRTGETDTRIKRTMDLSELTRSQGFIRDIEQTGQYIDGLRNESIAGLGDMIDAAQSRDGTGAMRNLAMRMFDVDNPAMTADVVREVFVNGSGSTGNKVAQAGAKAWLSTIEAMRLRFNAAGGDVGKLGYGYLSQAHDAAKVRDAGAADWSAKVMPLLDREQYVKPDGQLLNDAEMLDLLRGAHDTLATGGLNKVEPGSFRGTGARANRGSESRVLHFKDGDAWMGYMNEFGEGSLYDAMVGHVGKMARDIGLVERYGPNPEQQYRVQLDVGQRVDDLGGWAGIKDQRLAGTTAEAYWNVVSGKAATPENVLLSQVGLDLRNIQTAAKLGGAVLTSTTDMGTIVATLHYNKLPYFDMLRNIGKQFKGDTRDFLQSHGVIAESLTSTLNRWTGDNMTHSLTGRVAGSVMKLSLMNAWTDGLRNAFSMTLMGGLGKMSAKQWGDLTAWDRHLLERKGLTEADWSVVNQAQLTDYQGRQFLTPESIKATGAADADQVATKVLAFTLDEANFAVVNPDVATRAIVTGGGRPAGTIDGELWRAFAQFKSFPIAMLTRHWRRVLDTPQGLEGAPAGFGAESAAGAAFNKVAVLAALNLTLTMIGGMVLQNKAIVQGKDPYDMTEPKFWMRAFTQGGGAGYLGDLLFKDPTEQRGNKTEQVVGTVLGPSAGAVAGLAGDLVVGNAWEAAKGKDTHIGAEALRWTNSQLPYSNLWWTRGAYEHWFLYSAQEALNPGYLARMKQRAQKDWQQGYWWDPVDAFPDRAPDFEQAIGGN